MEGGGFNRMAAWAKVWENKNKDRIKHEYISGRAL